MRFFEFIREKKGSAECVRLDLVRNFGIYSHEDGEWFITLSISDRDTPDHDTFISYSNETKARAEYKRLKDALEELI